MQCYTTTIVSSRRGATAEHVTFLVPFNSQASVIAFTQDLWKRVAKQNIPLSRTTHSISLHRDSSTGPLIDMEDTLSDVVPSPSCHQIFAVFSEKKMVGQPYPQPVVDCDAELGPLLSIRIVTPSSAHKRGDCPVLTISPSTTIAQLHNRIAGCLGEEVGLHEKNVEILECNCALGRELANHPSEPSHISVIHGKGMVERVRMVERVPVDRSSLRVTLFDRFGDDLESRKKVNYIGGEPQAGDVSTYVKPPVVAICSNRRHIPVHAKAEFEDEAGQQRSTVLDLHTHELPIHPACFGSTVEEAGLRDLAVDGVVDIFAVLRKVAGDSPPPIGKSFIFRSRAHWDPMVTQSDRGMAMFLSSLRVFASIVQDRDNEDHREGAFHNERWQIAVLHVLYSFMEFPPALRCIYLLFEDKTPTATESAALSHSMFEVLARFVPATIIGTDRTRVFEGARLFFGYTLEVAGVLTRSAKFPSDDSIPNITYFPAFQTTEIVDCRTNEAVMYPVQTRDGLVEKTSFDVRKEGLSGETRPLALATARHALLTGGTVPDVVVFSLVGRQGYLDNARASKAIDLEQLRDLDNLAELCARNKLAVYRPGQLTSAVTPCLTFDRNAHLAVYTGEEPCAEPGKSSVLFRPRHGEETIDWAVIEQLISPILQSYEADGSAIFDVLGGAEVRRLLAPDEILMFCVDCSASMRNDADFTELNEGAHEPEAAIEPYSEVNHLVDPTLYGQVSFDDVKEKLRNHESFEDMMAIITNAAPQDRNGIVRHVLELLRLMLSSQIISESRKLEHLSRGYPFQGQTSLLATTLENVKLLWAGLYTHADYFCDYLRYRADSSSGGLERDWTWSLGDPTPTGVAMQRIADLPSTIIGIPDGLLCPISHVLMEDAVTAADGHTYSYDAISRWFTTRNSSPLHGVALDDTTLTVNPLVRANVSKWIAGNDISGMAGIAQDTENVKVFFDCCFGTFTRVIPRSMTVTDLYALAFRGMKGRSNRFQLSVIPTEILPPSSSREVSSYGIRSFSTIRITSADEAPISDLVPIPSGPTSTVRSIEMCLIKVYKTKEKMLFSYWVEKNTTKTFASVIWKYWRYARCRAGDPPREWKVWTNLKDSGDGYMSGKLLESQCLIGNYLNEDNCHGCLQDEMVYSGIGDNNNAVTNSVSHKRPLVLKVMIFEQSTKPASHRPSRLDVLKQMFEATINRMLAYKYRTHVGLVTCSTTGQVTMPISHVLENFRRATVNMNANGDTALWDSLALASDQLEEYAARYPGVKKRIICISDGVDTSSQANMSHDVCLTLLKRNTVVDGICLGSKDNQQLRNVSYATGGYRFHPVSLVNALTICEMEPYLSLAERPTVQLPGGLPLHPFLFKSWFEGVKSLASVTDITDDNVPPCREHPNLHDDFVQLTAAIPRPTASRSGGSQLSLRTSRVMREMRAIVSRGPHPKYDVYVSQADMSFWKVVMEGPEDSPYAGGTFLLYLHADEQYPALAPKVRFLTKVKHPNINAHGRICHSIFDRDWTSDISTAALLDTVYGLLYQPEYSDPVNTMTTLGFHHDAVEFADEVREHVRKHALKSREDWKAALLA